MNLGPRIRPLLFLLCAAACAAAQQTLPPLKSAPGVDLKRFQGTWHEIAGIPIHWQRACVSTVELNYRLLDDGRLHAHYECTEKDGIRRERDAKIAVDSNDPSKWRVYHLWPFYERRSIVLLDPDYRWSAIGAPDRKHLWILSRSTQLNQDTLDRILLLARNRGFDTMRLVTSKQH